MAFKLVVFWTIACLFSGVSYGGETQADIYIVYMGEKSHDDPKLVTASHHRLLTSLLGSKEVAKESILYSYTHGFSGFAATLTKSQAEELQGSSGVISIKRSRTHRLDTTRSWDFIGLTEDEPVSSELLSKANYGDGVIIGIIDTGIWPEARSFSDEGYGPVPSRWKGTCETGEKFNKSSCNRKIIGARWYAKGVSSKTLKNEFQSARDLNGHGTHTASTAAGNSVGNASFMGLGAGTARGGAAKARLAIYKACWGGGTCLEAAVLKAIDDAIHDGVDIISVSIGADGYPSASIRAVANGVSVIFSAGNDGPGPQTVGNALPWVTTVAATSIDRSFSTFITLGDSRTLVGQSIYYGNKTSLIELAYGERCDAASLNRTEEFAGKIVLCYSPDTVVSTLPRFDLPDVITNIKQVGARGLIYAQYTANVLESLTLCDDLPCVLVDFRIASIIVVYMSTESTPVVQVHPTHNGVGTQVLAPKVAAFSSRGPSSEFPDLLKPDIAAPGVSILAAYINTFKFSSGTSMACPHVSGVFALLKAIHPDWSPAALKSAIITTASSVDGFSIPIEGEGLPRKIADPLDYGGGQIDPNRAADPGLIFEINPDDYFDYFNCSLQSSDGCGGGEAKPLYFLNLPSISIPELKNVSTVWRSVTNVGEAEATYNAVALPPPGVEMTVEPSVLEFSAAKRVRSFAVTFKPLHRLQGDFMFGSIVWTDGGKHSVKMQVAVRVVIQSFYSDTA